MTTYPLRAPASGLLRWMATVALALGLAGPLSAAQAAFTDDEVSAFGRQVATWINEGDQEVLVQHLDQFAFLDKVTTGLGMSADVERDFRAGMMSRFSQNFASQFEQFDAARFLRVEDVQGVKRALVRLEPETDGVSYISFIPSRRSPTAPMQWSDAFLYLAGETFAEGARRTTSALFAGQVGGLVKVNSGGIGGYMREMQQMSAALMAGDAKTAWAASERIPAEVRKDRSILLLRLRAAQGIDDPTYLRVINEWQAAYPNDPTLEFHSIDGSILRKDYAAALRHIENFGRRIGGDNFLDLLTANVLVLMERYPEARARARGVLAAEPTLYGAYDVLLGISLKQKDHRETVALLTEFEGKLKGVNMVPIVDEEGDYAEFRKSPEYKAWVAAHAPAPGAKK